MLSGAIPLWAMQDKCYSLYFASEVFEFSRRMPLILLYPISRTDASMKNVIAYYITPHGFGHAIRSLEIIREMYRLAPQLEVVLISTIPEWLVALNVGRTLPMRRVTLDIGVIQQDNVRMDLPGTLEALLRLKQRANSLLETETRFLREEKVRGVVSDVAFLPFLSARACGLPSVGVGNFTWDWIYEFYTQDDSRWAAIVEWIRTAYGSCGLFLQLPLHGDCSACPRVQAVPLVARRSDAVSEEIRRALSLPAGKKAFLLAFTDLKLNPEATHRIQRIEWACFLHRKPLHIHLTNGLAVNDPHLLYQDVLAASDGVITKPGYGIVSDCLANGTPMLYSDRGKFPEYEILVREVESQLSALHLPVEDLLEGRWEKQLEKLVSLPKKERRVSSDGASVCARHILNHIGI